MVVAEEQEYEFWPDKIAKELVTKWGTKKQVIMTGTSMSGDPHIGNANDVIRGDAIRLAVKSLRKPVNLIWISDDMDPFRAVPADLPKELEEYLGIPASNIPDFWKCHRSFTVHFEEKMLKQLETVNVKPKVLLGIEMYKNGMYNDIMKIAMEKRKDIAEIINKFRTTPLPEEWYPVDVICKKCGKIATTKILDYYPKTAEVDYFCDPKEILLHRKSPVAGCGNKGKMSILDGNAKLTWRVEWAARWVFLKATCEPFGKEHAAAGGSWDTAKEIVKLFDWEPPYPVVYEHFLVNGEKMSKSKGNVITVYDILKYMSGAHLRYWMFQGRLTIAKDIKLSIMVPKLFDEFDKAERIFFGKESANDKRKDNNYKRAYELAVIKTKKKETIDVPYEKLVEIVKISPSEGKMDFIVKKLEELKYGADTKLLEERVKYVENWIEDFQKTEEKKVMLDEKGRGMIRKLIGVIEKESDSEKLQLNLFETIKGSGLQVGEAFKLIYNIILNSDRGPRLGPYIIERGKEEITKKLRTAL
ncbi:MAG: lysine--tRNA ligase [Candidatus Aenigmarchaeota archaeon]|nr:lysine--tRNA ligase [Candidatus Aenigmarchaeota archaeon]